MTSFSRDNFERMLQRRHPYRLPFDIAFTRPVNDRVLEHLGIGDPVVAFDLDFRAVAAQYKDDVAQWRAAYSEHGIAIPAGYDIGWCGNATAPIDRSESAQAHHIPQTFAPLSAISSVNDLKSFPWPDVQDDKAFDHLALQVSKIQAEERVAMGLIESTAFDPACSLRGLDALVYDLHEGGEIGNWLLDFFTARSIHIVRQFCKAGVDVIRLGDDVGTQRGMLMSVDFWRQHIKPRLVSVIKEIWNSQTRRVAISYSSDGDIRAILPDLVDMGIDIIRPMPPECMPIDEVIGQYRSQLAFWGMIGTQSVMPFGTPEDIDGQVRHLANWVRRGASIIVSPTHALEPDVPWDNVSALARAVRNARL
ncbi:MAG: uroporphyrinogen decarboxylase family protein [Capsulimonadaceae bacterium]|nr:uroporphyrinogen decarboxylase family protein [Capsulimonadaceae bacterium]